MNIKRAKEEIEHTVKAYLAKDALGEYAIPAIRRPPPCKGGALPAELITHFGTSFYCKKSSWRESGG